MMMTLKSEFRKLLSVKSTYIIVLATIAFLALFDFWIMGYQSRQTAVEFGGIDQFFIWDQVLMAIQSIAALGALVSILLVTHEYRYNTIVYTLTNSNSRSKVLFSKAIVSLVFSLVFTLLMALIAGLFLIAGLKLGGANLVDQTIYYKELIAEVLAYGVSYGLIGLVAGVLIKNQIGAVVTIFFVPGITVAILSALLKNNAVYTPLNALEVVITSGGGTITKPLAFLIFLGYFVLAWLITWLLFLRRDAN